MDRTLPTRHLITVAGATLATAVALASAAAPQSTSEVRALQPRDDTYPALSADGRYLVYASGTGFDKDLHRLDLDTGQVLALTDNEHEDSAAAWSPDGRRLVFMRETVDGNRDLWLVGADGSGERNLTATPGAREQHPRFTPDGSGVVFDANLDDTDPEGGADGLVNYEIYTRALEGGATERLTRHEAWDMYPSLSPDGGRLVWRRQLASTAGAEHRFDLFVKDLATGVETNLTDDEHYDTNPHWSPTGEWIVFASNRDGAFDLHVMRPDGSGRRRITMGAAGVLGFARPSFSGSGDAVVANRTVPGVIDIVQIDFPEALRALPED